MSRNEGMSVDNDREDVNPYYTDGLVTLYCGSVNDVLPALTERFDLIFTSPPYNLGVNPTGQFGHWEDGGNRGGRGKWSGVVNSGVAYDVHDDAMPYPEYQAWQKQVLTWCWEHLTDTGAIYYNHKPRVQVDSLWLPLELNPGLPVRQIIIWDRGSGPNFNPTSYVSASEWIIVFGRPDFRLRDQSASGLGDVWRVAPARGNGHPAPFPPGLPARAIETTAPSLILDPFAGSGSTLVAASAAGISSIGIELSAEFCEQAVQRLKQPSLFAAEREEPAVLQPMF